MTTKEANHHPLRLALAGIVLAGTVLIERVPAAETSSSSAEMQELTARMRSLDPREQRELFLFHARLKHTELAEAAARHLLEESPGDQEILAALARMQLDAGAAGKALETALQLAGLHPDFAEGRSLLASAYYHNGQFDRALTEHQKLKADLFPDRPYPYETDLAYAAYQAGEWQVAAAAYESVQAREDLNDEQRRNAREMLSLIAREHGRRIALSGTATFTARGEVFRTGAEFFHPVHRDHEVFARWLRREAHLDGGPAVRNLWTAENEGWAGVNSALGSQWDSSLWIGGGEEAGVLGGASLRYEFEEHRNLRLLFAGNEQATDGILLESLLGRQHRLALAGEFLPHPDWLAALHLHGREVRIDDQSFGWGHGGLFTIEYLPIRSPGEMRLGWRSLWQNFSRDVQDARLVAPISAPGASVEMRESTLRSLVLPWVHREGAYAAWQQQLLPGFTYRTTAGVDYAFERSSFEYYGFGGLEFAPARNVRLSADAGYFSSAAGSGMNESQWQVALILRLFFK